ncbi:hypothetical protein GCM10009549_17690 [Streptomyces thermoalcalitolerans]|uniref:Uncharacterized protein n=1 Tax=Streptomyces thermoalcalitolerans TaxID=65605 RepID=A0ABN1NJU2_9ACTN
MRSTAATWAREGRPEKKEEGEEEKGEEKEEKEEEEGEGEGEVGMGPRPFGGRRALPWSPAGSDPCVPG